MADTVTLDLADLRDMSLGEMEALGGDTLAAILHRAVPDQKRPPVAAFNSAL